MTRKYELKKRAERQEQTRRRIVDAAMELHGTVGPARTSIAAVADRAGVQRHTVYRHFPNEDDLFAACSAAWDERHPFPDPSPWFAIGDPDARLRRALSDVYAYYAEVEGDLSRFARDAELVPPVQRMFEAEAAAQRELRDALAQGWGVRGRRRRLLLATIGHALEFDTWRTLVRGQQLAPAEAAELAAGYARAAASA